MARTTVRRGGSSMFARLPSVSIQRSKFDRSHGYKTTFDEGYLIPFFVDEVLPGDTFSLNLSMLCRLTTPIVPFMDNLYLRSEFFFVPNRLIWQHWENMMGAQPEGPSQSTDYLVPEATPGGDSAGVIPVGSIGDFMGLPVQVSNVRCSELPLRAYSLIWDEWYRDENIQDAVNFDPNTGSLFVGDQPIGPTNSKNPVYYDSKPLRRNKFHDYFTSALPWPQKGTAAQVSLGTTAPVFLNASVHGDSPENTKRYDTFLLTNLQGHDLLGFQNVDLDIQPFDAPNLFADLSMAGGISINDLREAFQIQRWMEKNARGGTRYTEILRAHFGVVSPDSRLQRPEYLGGSRQRIYVTPVAQTSSTDAETPQGNLSAFAATSQVKRIFSKSFVEHGWIIGLVSVQADLTYQQGMNRMWSRRDKLDFYWPTFSHLGEQAILNKEIYYQGTAVDNGVFGYQERYADYRYYPSMITGQMRSTAPEGSLDFWHLAQKFSSLPTLSYDFIIEDPPVERVVAVPSQPHFLLDAWFDLKCTRPMPLYGTPGLIDHF